MISSHAMGNSEGGFKEYWDLIRKYPNYQGGFIWDFVDQALRWKTKDGRSFYAYGGDFNAYDASDNNFNDNGLIGPDRIPNPHAYEVRQQYQSIWATPADLTKGTINVYNENFFIDLSNYYMEWQLLANGEVVQSGTVNDLNVAPQQTATLQLNYSTDKLCKMKELLLNVSFKLKTASQLLPAGYVVAKNQLVIRSAKSNDMKKENCISRRTFLKSTAVAGALGAIGTGTAAGVFTSCSSGDKKAGGSDKPLREPGSYYIPELPDKAPDGKPLKVGIIGCGGRGSGATFNFLDAANGLTVTALGDVFQDRLENLANDLKTKKNIDVPADKRFIGLDAYKKVIDSGVDCVIVATPPVFRPIHFQYAVEKGIHAFLEKPICVDPVGYRTIMAAAKQAAAKNLAVVTGTQRHHKRNYVESFQKIMDGAIGEITGGQVYWNQSMLWYKERQPQWSDFECMVRDWVNWKWLSGDHIVEQHVHNIDVFTWFSGLKPVSAVSFGSRERRITGDQFDFFSTDFTMENGIHLHSMCRQIDGCANNVSEFIQGTKGSWPER